MLKREHFSDGRQYQRMIIIEIKNATLFVKPKITDFLVVSPYEY